MQKNIKLICPFTNEDITDKFGCYIRWESKRKNIPKNDLKYLVYEKSFGDWVAKEKFTYLYEVKGYSLPDFFKEYKAPYILTLFLIDYHNIKKRTHSECCTIGAVKSKKTNLERYGVDQTFKVKEFDEKRKKTYMDKYGVENPFEKGTCLKNIEEIYMTKYGISFREHVSRRSKKAWSNKSPEDREKWLESVVGGTKTQTLARKSWGKNNCGSFLEKRVANALLDLDLKLQTQFRLKRYRFDFLLDEKVLIEVNGDHFHGNPEIYNEDDIFALTKKTAKQMWEKDAKKADVAKESGYDLVVIWESEIKFKSKDGILQIFLEKYEKLKNSKNNEIR